MNRSTHNILVVNDHEPSRYALARGLGALGYQTTEAVDGTSALELARSVSAVVLDVHLRNEHGFDVCRNLRKASPSLPVVHVSAVYVKASDQIAGRMAGADAYFVAPIQTEQLATKLDELISRRAGGRSN